MEHGYTHEVTRLADWSKGRNLFTLIGGQSVPIRGLRIRDLGIRNVSVKFVSGSDVQRETRIVLAAVFPHFIGTYKSNGIFNTC